MFRLNLIAAIVAPCVVPLTAAVPDGWFAWPMVEPVDGSALDTRALTPAPAGASGRITTKNGHFVLPDGTRIRFWGCNLGGAEAFPSAEDASLIARRLAKGGVNIARLHHLDNPWGVEKGHSLWSKDREDHGMIDPAQLDILHRLIAALKEQGVYSNLNLKVSKSLTAADGFADTVTQIADFQKRVDIFDPRMIELQKEYARQLLTAINPYTGLSAADDPAVAVIEINNENSLLGYWTRDLGRNLDKLPEPFRGGLIAQWNAWLARRYKTDALLKQAWAPRPAAGTTPNLVTAATSTWECRARHGAGATITPGGDASALMIDVTHATGTDWHVQLGLHGLKIDDGEIYTIEFEARATKERSLGVGVSVDPVASPEEPWRSFGLLDSATIGRDWSTLRFIFPAHSVGRAPAVLNINAGAAEGQVWLRRIRMYAGCEDAGLHESESPRNGTVPIPTHPTVRQWSDWIAFLAETERAFAGEMRRFLKEDLGVQAPIACTQIEYGGITGLWREQSMDFADSHMYWEHPQFAPGAGWDEERWKITNSPMIATFSDRSFGELGERAMNRVAGKPFAISEYDHPAPSDFACEMYPVIASFAARQDWDAIYPFAIGAYGSENPDNRIKGYFDQLHQPAKWGLTPFAARLFRNGLLERAPAYIEMHPGTPFWATQMHTDMVWRRLLPNGSFDFLDLRYAVNNRSRPAGSRPELERRNRPTPGPVSLVDAPQGRVYRFAAPAAAAIVGHVGGANVEAGPLTVACERFGRDFAACTVVSLDDKPLAESARMLVTLVARAENQDMGWDQDRTTVRNEWGHGPTIAERVPATITLAGIGACEVHALTPNGTRAGKLPIRIVDNAITFSVGAEDNTLHYEIVRR